MTKQARWVLKDCKEALSRHSDGLQGEDFRISWVAIVSLLRAVGHVLQKVDSKASEDMARVIDKQWHELRCSKAKNPIYWEFIDKQRNNVLKQYELGISRGLRMKGPLFNGQPTTLEIDQATSRGGRGFSPGAEHFSYITFGPFAGRRESDVVQEAIQWWEEYLDEVDRLVQIELLANHG